MDEQFSASGNRNKFSIAEWIQEFRPTNRYHYFDRIRIHVKGSPSPEWLEDLRKECRAVKELGTLWFNPAYQKLEIYQPNSEALRLLATLPDNASVAYIEVACDVIAPDESSLENISAAFQHGFLQPHRRKKRAQAFRADSGRVTGITTRTNPNPGERRRGHWFQFYSDRPCKITGELHCFHFEGKYEGAQAVKSLGIYHPRDLENFSFDEYFSKHASKLYCINHDRLGRFDDNRRNRGKRKKSHTGKWNSDRYRGHRIYRILSLDHGNGNSLQTFVDRYGRGPFLEAYDISMFIGTNGFTSLPSPLSSATDSVVGVDASHQRPLTSILRRNLACDRPRQSSTHSRNTTHPARDEPTERQA